MIESTCPHCYGEGTIVICFDDLCAGEGRCIHGDGERMCRACKGQGVLYWDDGLDEVDEDDCLAEPV